MNNNKFHKMGILNSNLFLSVKGFYGTILFFFFFIPVLLAFDVRISMPITDGFHEGEYLGAIENIKSYFRGELQYPILIHGAMDYIPALISSLLRGEEKIIVWTRFINIFFVALSWILWLDIARTVAKKNDSNLINIVFFYVVFFIIAASTGDDPVRKQQAFLGTRDIFLILCIWASFKSTVSKNNKDIYVYLIIASFAAAISIYWSYDRGVMAVAFFCLISLLGFFMKNRLVSIVSFICFFIFCFIISSLKVFGSYFDVYRNISYWLKYSGEVWSMPIEYKTDAILGSIAMSLLAILFIGRTLHFTLKRKDYVALPFVAALSVVQLLLLTKLYALPGFPNTYYYIWPSFTLFLLCGNFSVFYKITTFKNRSFKMHRENIKKVEKKNNVFGCITIFLIVTVLISNNLVKLYYTAIQIVRPPLDSSLIDKRKYGFEVLDGKDYGTVMNYTNEGVFSFVGSKKFISNFPYSVYVSGEQESVYLQELINNPPDMIVYDSPYWSKWIYGRSMEVRLPLIERFIRENYDIVHSASGYAFGFKTPSKDD